MQDLDEQPITGIAHPGDAGKRLMKTGYSLRILPAKRSGSANLDRGANMCRSLGRKLAAVAVAAAVHGGMPATAQTIVKIGIGTQDTTTNTVTAGTVIRELKLLDKYLPKDDK